MSYNPWPSERPSTTRASKYRPTYHQRTDWFTGWIVTLFILAVVTGVGFALWPVASHAFEALSTITETLEQATSRQRL